MIILKCFFLNFINDDQGVGYTQYFIVSICPLYHFLFTILSLIKFLILSFYYIIIKHIVNPNEYLFFQG